MCGLVGILGCKGPDEERRQLVHAMAETMVVDESPLYMAPAT